MALPKLMHRTEFDGNPQDSLGADSRHCITNMRRCMLFKALVEHILWPTALASICIYTTLRQEGDASCINLYPN
jgi:hypothetical protein